MYLGIDIGGTNLKSGIIDDAGQLVYSSSMPTNAARGADLILRDIIAIIRKITPQYSVKTIGIGVPGIVKDDGTIAVAPNLPGWNDIQIGRFLRSEFALPIAIDNDANAAAIAELELGAGKDINSFIYVTLGTGVGGAIIHNGKLFRGEDGGTGEIGHIIINANDDEYPCVEEFRTGTLEEYTGREKIINLFNNLVKNYPESILYNKADVDVSDISDAVYAGDKVAIKCFETVGKYLGVGLASAMNLLDIKTAIIGGGISQAHPILLESALSALKKRALPTVALKAKILTAHFSKDAGIVGAALLGKVYCKQIKEI